jgi:hypothetical protein
MDAISMTQVRLEPQTQTPTFLVVKFISDIRRQEPRNIGVILLHKTGVYSRFFGEDLPDPQNESGIDGRRVKNLISDTKTYEQWVRYWRYCTEPYAVLDPETAALPLAQCYKLLLESSKQNFIVTTGGRILTSDLEHKQPSTMLTWLYNVLVEEDEYGTLENVDLRRATENFLSTAGILSHPLLIRDLSVKVNAPKIKKQLTDLHLF